MSPGNETVNGLAKKLKGNTDVSCTSSHKLSLADSSSKQSSAPASSGSGGVEPSVASFDPVEDHVFWSGTDVTSVGVKMVLCSPSLVSMSL